MINITAPSFLKNQNWWKYSESVADDDWNQRDQLGDDVAWMRVMLVWMEKRRMIRKTFRR